MDGYGAEIEMKLKIALATLAIVFGLASLTGCATRESPTAGSDVESESLTSAADCGSYTSGFVLPEPGGPQTPAAALEEWKAWVEEAARSGFDASGGLSSPEDMLMTARAAIRAVDATETPRGEHGTETRVLAKDADGNLLGVVVVAGDEEVGFIVSEFWILHDDGRFCRPSEAALGRS